MAKARSAVYAQRDKVGIPQVGKAKELLFQTIKEKRLDALKAVLVHGLRWFYRFSGGNVVITTFTDVGRI